MVSNELKTKIIDSLATASKLVTLQDAGGNFNFYTLEQKAGAQDIILKNREHIQLQSSEANFYIIIDAEIYTFPSTFKQTTEYIYVTIPENIYRLQRRENFRVNIPTDSVQNCQLTDWPDLEVKITDLSLGGALIRVTNLNPSQVTKDQSIKIIIQLLDIESEPIEALVRSIKKPNAKCLLLGIEFIKPSSEVLQAIQSTLVKISRLNKKTYISE